MQCSKPVRPPVCVCVRLRAPMGKAEVRCDALKVVVQSASTHLSKSLFMPFIHAYGCTCIYSAATREFFSFLIYSMLSMLVCVCVLLSWRSVSGLHVCSRGLMLLRKGLKAMYDSSTPKAVCVLVTILSLCLVCLGCTILDFCRYKYSNILYLILHKFFPLNKENTKPLLTSPQLPVCLQCPYF